MFIPYVIPNPGHGVQNSHFFLRLSTFIVMNIQITMPKNYKPIRKGRKAGKKRANQRKRNIKAVASLAFGSENVKMASMVAAGVKRAVKPYVQRNFTPDTLALGDCAWKYLQSFVDPFSQEARGACVPSTPSEPSQKVTAYIRGSGIIGTGGYGFVSMAPGLSNDAPCVYYSSGVGGSIYSLNLLSLPPTDQSLSAAATGNGYHPAIAYFSQIPYTFSQVTKDVGLQTATTLELTGRIVSASMRVTYTGTALNQSGLIVGVYDPNGNPISGNPSAWGVADTAGYNMTSAMSLASTEIEHNNRKGLTLVITPPFDSADGYSSDLHTPGYINWPWSREYEVNSADQYYPNPSAAIMLTGASGSPFFFECVQHIEYRGPLVNQGMLTPNDPDPVGESAVRDIVSRARQMAADEPGMRFGEAVKRAMSRLKIVRGHKGRVRSG